MFVKFLHRCDKTQKLFIGVFMNANHILTKLLCSLI